MILHWNKHRRIDIIWELHLDIALHWNWNKHRSIGIIWGLHLGIILHWKKHRSICIIWGLHLDIILIWNKACEAHLQKHFRKPTVLVSYMPHQNKNAILFSSLHNDDAIVPSSGYQMKTRHHNILYYHKKWGRYSRTKYETSAKLSMFLLLIRRLDLANLRRTEYNYI